MIKKSINILSLIAAFLTSLTIIFTLLTTYQFVYINQLFNSYYPIQLGIFITMALWGVRFSFYENGKRKYGYSIICCLIAVSALIFMYMYVK